jgi:hypothetical protein
MHWGGSICTYIYYPLSPLHTTHYGFRRAQSSNCPRKVRSNGYWAWDGHWLAAAATNCSLFFSKIKRKRVVLLCKWESACAVACRCFSVVQRDQRQRHDTARPDGSRSLVAHVFPLASGLPDQWAWYEQGSSGCHQFPRRAPDLNSLPNLTRIWHGRRPCVPWPMGVMNSEFQVSCDTPSPSQHPILASFTYSSRGLV